MVFGFTTLETCSNSFYSAIKLNKKLGAYNAVRSYNLMTDYLPVFPNTESREKNLKASSGISQKSDNPNKRVVGGGWVANWVNFSCSFKMTRVVYFGFNSLFYYYFRELVTFGSQNMD